MSTKITQLPQDKTPAQRARIKLIEQFALVFFINAVLAGYVLFSSYATGARPNWTVVVIAAVAQGLLALFNVIEKYFSANNEPLFSALFDAAKQEVQAKAPPVPYSPMDLSFQQAANAAFQPTYTMPAQAPVPSSLRPVTLQPILGTSTSMATVSVPNIAPANAVPLTTIPAMPVVQPQQ